MIFGPTINKYYKKYAIRFFLGILALIVVNYAQLEIPRLTGELIDGLAEGVFGQADIIQIIGILAGVGIIITIGRFFWRIGIIGASRRIDYDIRNEMFEKSLLLSNDFYSHHKVGGLMAHFINDTQAVRMAAGPGIIMLVDAIFLGSFVFFRMYQLSPSLTLLIVLPLSTIAVVGTILGNRMRKRFKIAQKAFEDLSDFTQESFSGINVVKAFVKEGIELREFLKTNQNTKEKNIAYVRLATILQIVVQAVVSLVFILIILVGSQLVINTENTLVPFTVGSLVAFSSYFGLLVWPIMAITMIIRIRSQGRASLERIDDILYAPVDVYDAEDVLDVDTLKGDISFKNLHFTYADGDAPALKNITMDITTGQTVGILGRTGSGKTSIVDLLLRIHNVDRGQLFIDGIDIMQIPLKTLRESFGYVPQDGFLFSDSIKNNIALGLHHDPDIQKVEDVAMMSDVHDNIIHFKDGYETIIGERGVTLSGGQKQRVSIARALLKDAPILILDDAVSAVDTATEEKILNNLKATRKGKTTLMIAHRISTVKYADVIVLIDEGEVVATGTHSELLKSSELYQKMVQQQSLSHDGEVV